ncbi:hypothetical protein V5799_011935, partial [Amblyomma americanum]
MCVSAGGQQPPAAGHPRVASGSHLHPRSGRRHLSLLPLLDLTTFVWKIWPQECLPCFMVANNKQVHFYLCFNNFPLVFLI